MKTILSIISLTVCLSASAQTNPIPDIPLKSAGALRSLEQFGKAFFVDNKRFFGEKTVTLGLDAAYSHGRDKLDTGPKRDTFGGVLTVGFPLDEKGQVSIGLWAAYFNNEATYGSFQTTLGTTFTVPDWFPVIKGQQVFVFNEGGPGYRLNGDGEMFAQDFVGGVWKHEFKNNWTLYITGAYGTVTVWDGDIYLLGLKLGKKF